MDFTQTSSLFSVQSALRQYLFDQFQTGNPLVDLIVTILVTTLVGKLMTASFYSLFPRFRNIKQFCVDLKQFIVHFIFGKNTVLQRCDVKRITPSGKVNPIFQDLVWFLNTAEKEVESDNFQIIGETDGDFYFYSTDDIKKHPNTNTLQKIVFEGVCIDYVMTSELMTIYAEEERKKENRMVSFSAILPAKDSDFFVRFVKYATESKKNHMKNLNWEQRIYHNDSTSSWSAKKAANCKTIKNVILPKKEKEMLLEDLEHFKNNRDWYKEKGFPYNRKYLIHGPPGCGKSSIIKAMSKDLKRHLCMLNLSKVKTDDELRTLISQLPLDPFLVIEDIDCMTDVVFERDSDKKPNTQPKEKVKLANLPFVVVQNDNDKGQEDTSPKLTLSAILNFLDGTEELDNAVVVITTNKPQILDKALTRAGRINKRIHLQKADRFQLCEFYNLIFEKQQTVHDACFQRYTDQSLSPAEISNYFAVNNTRNSEQVLSEVIEASIYTKAKHSYGIFDQ